MLNMNDTEVSNSTLSERLHNMAGELYNQTRKNAKKRKIDFSLTRDELDRLFDRACGKCEVSGLPFAVVPAKGKRRPFAPSIDRKNSSLGYSFRNCRIVCVAVNLALNEWGDKVFLQVAASCLSPEENPAMDAIVSERDALLAENKSLRRDVYQLRQRGMTDDERDHKWGEFKKEHGFS